MRLRKITLSALVAIIVALAGFEATCHQHALKPDGWHTSGPQGDAAHDEDHKSCSMCRLAHDTSSTPAAPAGIALPLPQVASSQRVSSALAPVAMARENSPRAPPRSGAC